MGDHRVSRRGYMLSFIIITLNEHISVVNTWTIVKHSLKFFVTATSGVQDIPEFIGSVLVDEVQVGYYDSNTKTAEPKVDWARKFLKDDPKHLEFYVNQCYRDRDFLKATIGSLMKRLNQTGSAHILQRMSGCEWDDETGEIRGFNQYGYDGEDFIVLDLQTLTWIAPKPQAFITKQRWDPDKARLDANKYYYTVFFPGWLKKYLHYFRSSWQRTDLPSVSLLQKTPSSPVTCHATGFYPKIADMFWRKDGEDEVVILSKSFRVCFANMKPLQLTWVGNSYLAS
uniref:Major histocompatibility complex class I-related gene protein-like n=1 Tax=Acanthochromis polyacanthus TaxID=80966 RepID=A0A3Q1F8J6_9TELE